MGMYAFHLLKLKDTPVALEVFELATDADAFAKGTSLLHEHRSCDFIEVWDGDRAVVGRHRTAPIIRTVATVSAART